MKTSSLGDLPLEKFQTISRNEKNIKLLHLLSYFKVFSYLAYGLNIFSEIALPEFISDDSLTENQIDLKVTIDRSQAINDLLPTEAINQGALIQLNLSQALIYVRGTGVFIVENGTQVTIIPDANSQELLIRFYLVGTIMGIVLYQRNLLVLHASAINIDGGAVAFLGISGEGKSSTAATFVAHGYNIITDDVAPIDLTTDPLIMYPGFPQVKVGAEIAQALGYDYETLPAVHTFKEKRALQPHQGFCTAPVPLKRIYVLTTDTEFAIAPIRPSEAVTELARHSRPTTLYHSGGAAHFFQCANLIKKHTIYRLSRPKNTSLLAELVKQVEQDLSQSPEVVSII